MFVPGSVWFWYAPLPHQRAPVPGCYYCLARPAGASCLWCGWTGAPLRWSTNTNTMVRGQCSRHNGDRGRKGSTGLCVTLVKQYTTRTCTIGHNLPLLNFSLKLRLKKRKKLLNVQHNIEKFPINTPAQLIKEQKWLHMPWKKWSDSTLFANISLKKRMAYTTCLNVERTWQCHDKRQVCNRNCFWSISGNKPISDGLCLTSLNKVLGADPFVISGVGCQPRSSNILTRFLFPPALNPPLYLMLVWSLKVSWTCCHGSQLIRDKCECLWSASKIYLGIGHKSV